MIILPARHSSALIAVMLLAAIVVGVSGSCAAEGNSIVLVGEPAPTFCLPRLDGSKFYLSDLVMPKEGEAGPVRKTVILNFFATYCKPCRREMPVLDSLARCFSRDSLSLVFIDAGEKRDTVLRFLNNCRLNESDIIDAQKLAVRLCDKKNPVSTRIASQLDPADIESIATLKTNKAPSEAYRAFLANALNKILTDTSFYTTGRFQKAVLAQSTRQLLSAKSNADGRERLNRALLEDTYNGLIVRKIYLADRDCPWTTLVDQFSLASDKYNAKSYPTTVVIDKNGRVRHYCTGFNNASIDGVKHVLDSLFNREIQGSTKVHGKK